MKIKFSEISIKMITICFFAFIVGFLVLKNNFFLVVAIPALLLYFLLLSWEWKFILCVFFVFFPWCLPHLGPIPYFNLVGLFSPIFCLGLAMDILHNKQQIFIFRKGKLFILGISVLIIWSIVNFIRRPVSGQFLFGGSANEGGIRNYYVIFTGVTTFFSGLWFVWYKKCNPKRLFIFLISFALCLGCLQIAGHFVGFNIPFLGGAFQFQPGDSFSFWRICGLEEMAILGIAALLGLSYRQKLNKLIILLFFIFGTMLFLSGGRTAFFGTLFGLFVFFIFIDRKHLFYFSVIILLITLVLSLCSSSHFLSDQIRRIFSIEGGFAKQDLYRYYTFKYYWEIFLNYPIFGKGIGYLSNIAVGNFGNDFISQQLMSGGHSAYLSILATFGIGGIFFLLSMLWGAIFYGYKILRNAEKHYGYSECHQLVLFSFTYLLILSIVFIAGGNGFNSMEMWFLVGVIAGLMSRIRNVYQFK